MKEGNQMRLDRLFLLFLADVEITVKQGNTEFTLKRSNLSLEDAINVFNNLDKRATFTVKESDYDHYFNDDDNYDYDDDYEYDYDYEED